MSQAPKPFSQKCAKPKKFRVNSSEVAESLAAIPCLLTAALRTGISARFISPLTMKALRAMALLCLLAKTSDAALMKTANYNNPVTRQQHFDLGKSYGGTVVHLMSGTNFAGSGVVVNNSRCVVMAAHEFENGPGGTFQDPTTENFYVRTGPNYLNNPGTSIRISQLIRHPTRTAPGVGTDSAIAILESDLPGAIPTSIAGTQPVISEVLDLVGFGDQATASVSSWSYITPTSGDIIAGKAPVDTIDSGIIKTRFLANSTQSLIYNGTPGDSGGGLFNSQRQLCGTLSQASSIAGSANTYSVNLISISPWIQQITSPYNVTPTLHIEKNANQVALKAFGSALTLNGGSWLPQKSTNLVDWVDTAEQFSGNTCSITTSEPTVFYRLRWSTVQ